MEVLSFGPLVFNSVGGAMLFTVSVGVLAGILTARAMRPVCRHVMEVQNVEVDPEDFEKFFNTDSGKAILCKVAMQDPRLRDLLIRAGQ